MHEFSIVQSLMGLVEEYARQEKAQKVEKVVVLMGPLSGVEAHLLKLAFDTFKEGTIAQDAQLVLEEAPLKVYCEECDREYEKQELNVLCPVCKKPAKLVSGDELYLKSLELSL